MSEESRVVVTGMQRTTTINGQSCTHHIHIMAGWYQDYPHPKEWEGQTVTCPVCRQMIGYHYRNVYYGCLPDSKYFYHGISVWDILRDVYIEKNKPR